MSFILPFKHAEGHALELGFLWRKGSVYIMDNHRAALWCWAQDPAFGHANLLHIDAHFDAQAVNEPDINYEDINAVPSSIEDFLCAGRADSMMPQGILPHFRWDNFISIYIKRFREKGRLCMATHEIGDKPRMPFVEHWPSKGLAEKMWKELIGSGQWIVDVDLDFFFIRDEEGPKEKMPDQQIKDVAAVLASLLKEGEISTLTLAMSPTCCTNREDSLSVLQTFCRQLRTDCPI